ncbi:S8 family serine peptidase [Anaerosacchariphilus polymeriproducens]|uniref:Peptidase S8/S53 domain-containing protein n=1 Tax=Anaerosacchariphilus polymeriproducens TaxID=1812858 RepID=A0A371AV14_9FIRM|nr:S8 family serine peptidase [Anaerosacchariphilus polymeriproducens]RDU23423.1 hypothetical protein DWV06_09455 [Anaerosacchariphilus polymeriproducens]
MNYDFYKKNFTGKNVRIAVLDSGVYLPDSQITHYNINDVRDGEKKKNIYMDYKENMHGTFCASEIRKIAPDAQIIDVNIADDLFSIKEEDIIKAVELCMEIEADIINLSLKMEKFSEKFFEKCQEAYSKGVFLIASSDGELSYPADFPDVIKVVSSEQDLEIEEVEENFISIKNYEFNCNLFGKVYKLKSSNSIACAHFSGLLSLILEARPLASNKELARYIFEDVMEDKQDIEQEGFVVNEKSVAAMSSDPHILINNLSELNKNIIGYYDMERKLFVNYKGEIIPDKDYNEILEINPYEYKRNLLTNKNCFRSKSHVYLGIFKGQSEKGYLKNHKFGRFHYINYIKKPVIFICSLGYSSSKFELQLELYKGLKEHNIRSENITYNPLGILFGFEVYDYPKNVNIPETIYSINHDLYELSKQESTDLVIANIAGGITQLNTYNRNNFGALFFAYRNAADADIIILTINSGINLDRLERQLAKLELENISKVILVISSQFYSTMQLESYDEVNIIPASANQLQSFYEEVKKRFSKYEVFSYNEVEEGKLTERMVGFYNGICEGQRAGRL